MSDRVRVYNLAKELGLSNRELLDFLHEEGLEEIKSHASTVDREVAELVKEHIIERQKEAKLSRETRALEVAAGPEEETPPEEPVDLKGKELHLKPPITVRDLAEGLDLKPNELIGELMTMNMFAAINEVLDVELVEKVCEGHGISFVRERRAKSRKAREKKRARELEKIAQASDVGEARPRAPVVAFLGHVDHGKTSLQDYIRKTHVVDGEAGGITQHIGASTIGWEGQRIVFLDTPGHAAFTAMRARGANATDLLVLVVAADDGVMPQTVEAINHARAADVPIIVACNKMDLPGANVDKVLLELQQNEVNTENWGGDVGFVPVSAITGEGIEDLLERILLEAEMLELTCHPEGECRGLVIEAQLEKGMGATANVLVTDGTLRVGETVLCGEHYGRIKALVDSRGERIKSAGPSTPVKILGLSGVPEAGEKVTVCADPAQAKEIAGERSEILRQEELSVSHHSTLEGLFQQMEENEKAELNLVVKTDVQGSLEAIIDSFGKIKSDKITVNIIHSAVGEVTENDVVLAAASDAIILGFHVRAMPGVNKMAGQHGVEIRLYSVIYNLIEEVEDAMRGQLAPEIRESPLGEAEIIDVFDTSSGRICGCRVNGGVIRVNAGAKVFREDGMIYNGKIASLRRFKDDVREVRTGLECGIRLDNFEDFEVGDIVRAVSVVEVEAQL